MSGPESTISGQDIPKDAVLASLQRILQSKPFTHCTSLRHALEYIVKNSFSSCIEHVKEYTIATQALGRAADFDPKTDNIVRVQIHRLREKLDEYYLTEGQGEPIRIMLPRGGYTPEYVRKPVEVMRTATDLPQPPGVSQVKRRGVNWLWVVSITLVVCSVILVVSLLRPLHGLPSGFRSLWQPFLDPNNPPLIVYANPAFLVGERGNLYRYDPPTILSMPMGSRVATLGEQGVHPIAEEAAGPFYYFDSYTGVGELVAATRIARFLTAYHEPFLIKRSRITSYDDIKNRDVIFLGGSKEDQILARLPLIQQLLYEPPPFDQYPMGSYIRDLNPPPGHPASYRLQTDPLTGSIQVEYGLISLLPNVSAAHYVLVLSGITTLGSEAAADFATSEIAMRRLEEMRAVAKTNKSPSRFLQVLLEVQVRDGVPLDVKCLLVRDLN